MSPVRGRTLNAYDPRVKEEKLSIAIPQKCLWQEGFCNFIKTYFALCFYFRFQNNKQFVYMRLNIHFKDVHLNKIQAHGCGSHVDVALH